MSNIKPFSSKYIYEVRKVIILIFITFCATVYGRTYYVATPENGGNDMYDGLDSVYVSGLHGPWASWQKAFTSLLIQPGDTIFIRGGVYYTTVTTGLGLTPTRHGTVNDWIVYMNYPGEKPIMDCGKITAGDIVYTGLRNQGITITNINYIKLQGLAIRNVNQYFDRNFGVGIRITDGNVILEHCTAHSIEGSGIVSSHGSEGGVHHIINCDAYDICDSIPPIGNVGNGIAVSSDYTSGRTYLRDCRAWHCADQGFNLATNAYVEVIGCWSFLNTETISVGGGGGGMGFKMGWQNIASPTLRRKVIKCVAAYNDGYGFFTNENGSSSSGGAVRSQHFNNIAYRNGIGLPSAAWGFIIQNTGQSDSVERWREFSNNISYDNSIDLYDGGGLSEYSGSNNTWDIPITLTDGDFVSIDTTGITAARQEDGSLPDNNCYNRFLKLAPNSKAINAGVNVGLPYNSSAPDLGPFESSDSEPTSKLVTRIDVVGYDGINTITGNRGTLQLSAIVFPSDATNKAVTWSIINGTGQATISPTGLVTAVSNGTVTARATSRDGSGVSGSLVIAISSQNQPTNTPPLVSISSPTKSTAFIAPATVTIEANAVDTDGVIVKVEFFNGNTKLGEKMTSPYEFTWKDVPAGSYSITAIATDNGNAWTVSGAVTVVVEKSATNANQLPIVSITSPANSGNNKKKYKKDDKITITAEAIDPDGSISMVEFKSGNITLAEVTSAPYSFTWEPSDTGTFVITAIATDNLGASSATSDIELSIVLLSESYTDNVSLYPNPNDGHFTVELVQGISELSNRLTIFNLAGQNVYSGILEPGERIKEVDISESTPGTYILMITDGKNILATKKLTKK